MRRKASSLSEDSVRKCLGCLQNDEEQIPFDDAQGRLSTPLKFALLRMQFLQDRFEK